MTKPNLNRLEYFVAIAEAGTITAAAKQMRVSKAVVSKQLQLLEEDMGVNLIIRNSRHLQLTEAGQTFFEAARASLRQAEEAIAIIQHGQAEPSGTLSITAPLDLGMAQLATVVAEFQATYPDVTINLELSDSQLDLVGSRFDVAYRVGWLTDSANIARKLRGFSQFAMASPGFVKKYGLAQHPSQLEALPFIENRALSKPLTWDFSHTSSSAYRANMQPTLSVNETTAIKAMVLEGAGISILPDFLVRQEQINGTLVRLLPEWSLLAGGIYEVFPPTQFRSTSARYFTELFSKRLREQLA